MKTYLNYWSIICAIFICNACGNSAVNTKTVQLASDSVPTITIRLPNIDSLQNLYLSEIADSVYYVALSDEPLLAGDNLRVETTDSVMIIGCAGPTQGDKTVRLYHLDGYFKRNIGGIGRGPGEYISPLWGINSNKNRAYIYTYMHKNSLQTYNLSGSNINMISKAKNDTVFHGKVSKIFPVGDNIIIAFNTRHIFILNNRELILYNPITNTIIDSLISNNVPKLEATGNVVVITEFTTSIFSEYKNELYSMSLYSDTLHRVTEKKILPFAIFKSTTENKAKLTGFMRTANMLYAQFYKITLNRGRVSFIYALNLNDFTERYCKGHFINDLDNGPDYSMSSDISSNPNQVFDVATLKTRSDDEFQWVKDRLFPDNKMPKKMKNLDEFQRLWDKSTENSNPIIQFFKLK